MADQKKGCCSSEGIREDVKKHYGGLISRRAGSCCSPPNSTEERKGRLADLAGYGETERSQVAEELYNSSFGCGNPLAYTEVKPGDVVLDLGSGAGLDVLLASKQVGPEGKVIGLDMTPEMIERARENVSKSGARNVEFRLGEMENMPVGGASVDWIISNCVINLSPDKERVFQEAFRVLKPGGRILISDIVAEGIPEDLKPLLWASCVGGAVDERLYLKMIKDAGFSDVTIVDRLDYDRQEIQGLIDSGCLDLSAEVEKAIVQHDKEWKTKISSVRVHAIKEPVSSSGLKPDKEALQAGCGSYFEAVAPEWEKMRQSFFSEAVREKAFSVAKVEPNKLAADLGAGTGFITEGLLQKGLKVIAVDQAEAMLTEMRRKFTPAAGIDYRVGESEHLPIADESVDYAFANMYLHHVASPRNAIREMVRILKPGGKLVITDLDEHRFEFLIHEHQDRWMGFNRDDVRKWFGQAGLKKVSVDCVGESCCATSSCGCESASVSIFVASGEKETGKAHGA